MIARLGLRRFYVLGLLISAADAGVRGHRLRSGAGRHQPRRRRRLVRAPLRGHRGHHRRHPAGEPAGDRPVDGVARRRWHLGRHRGAAGRGHVRAPGWWRAVRDLRPAGACRVPRSPGGRSGADVPPGRCWRAAASRPSSRDRWPDLSSGDAETTSVDRPLGSSLLLARRRWHPWIADRRPCRRRAPDWVARIAAAVPPPAWVQPGMRITFYSAAAAVAQSRYQLIEDPARAVARPGHRQALPLDRGHRREPRRRERRRRVAGRCRGGRGQRRRAVDGPVRHRSGDELAGGAPVRRREAARWRRRRACGSRPSCSTSSRPDRSVACSSCAVTTRLAARPTRP